MTENNAKDNAEKKSNQGAIGLCRCGMPIVTKDGKTGCINPSCANHWAKK